MHLQAESKAQPVAWVGNAARGRAACVVLLSARPGRYLLTPSYISPTFGQFTTFMNASM